MQLRVFSETPVWKTVQSTHYIYIWIYKLIHPHSTALPPTIRRWPISMHLVSRPLHARQRPVHGVPGQPVLRCADTAVQDMPRVVSVVHRHRPVLMRHLRLSTAPGPAQQPMCALLSDGRAARGPVVLPLRQEFRWVNCRGAAAIGLKCAVCFCGAVRDVDYNCYVCGASWVAEQKQAAASTHRRPENDVLRSVPNNNLTRTSLRPVWVSCTTEVRRPDFSRGWRRRSPRSRRWRWPLVCWSLPYLWSYSPFCR